MPELIESVGAQRGVGEQLPNYKELKELKAIFAAAKEDYEGGYLNSFQNLVQAEVFGTELDQAKKSF